MSFEKHAQVAVALVDILICKYWRIGLACIGLICLAFIILTFLMVKD